MTGRIRTTLLAAAALVVPLVAGQQAGAQDQGLAAQSSEMNNYSFRG